MGLPKQHTVDGPIEYIHWRDEAWDLERMDAEFKLLGDEERILHPVMLYNTGRTRYDRRGIEEYLLPESTPVVFTLERLGERDWARAKATERSKGREVAQVDAWHAGLVWVDWDELKLEGSNIRDRKLTTRDRDRLLEFFGPDFMREVGEAVLRASEPLSQDEKKSYDSLSTDMVQRLATLTDPAPSSTVEPTV